MPQASASSVWKNSAFVRTWAGSFVSQLGDSISFIILPLWLASTTRAPILIAAVNIVTVAVMVVVSPLAGALADRTPRRGVMLASDFARAGIMLALVYIAVHEPKLYWLVLILTGLRAAGSSFFSPASSAALSTIVAGEQIPSAVSIRHAAKNIVGVIGPAVGGWVIGIFKYPGGLAFDAFSFIVSGVILTTVRFPGEIPVSPAKTQLWKDLKAGLSLFRINRAISTLAFMAIAINFLGSALVIAIQIAAIREMTLQPLWYGILFSASPAGVALGAALSSKIKAPKKGKVILSCTIVMGLVNMAMGFSQNKFLFISLFFISGLAFGLANVLFSVMYRVIIPFAMQGRFFGLLNPMVQVAAPLGMSLAGVILTGMPAFKLISLIGFLVVLAGCFSLLSKEIRNMRVNV